MWAFTGDTVNEFAYVDSAFSAQECEEIILLGKTGIQDAYLIDGNVDKGYRDSRVHFLEPCPEVEWLYRKMTDIVMDVNQQSFGFDLFGFGEGLQFTEYKAPSGKYDYHIDKISGGIIRKLSIVIQLSDESSYTGGDLELKTGKDVITFPRSRGTAMVFPSYTLHRVTEVSSGVRHSLVGWVTGTPFK